MFDISGQFSRTIIDVHGETGERWLRQLPALIADCERRWSLQVLPPFALSYNYVAPAVCADGTPAVLKLGVPNPLLVRERLALQLYDGHGAARLLDDDVDRGILLLERVHPGTLLCELEDDTAATGIAAQVMRDLWRSLPAEHSFPDVAEWAAGLKKLRPLFGGSTGPLPPQLVEMAESLFADLLASMGEVVLIHADLHHYNILAAERAPWLALDPHGVAGEREYEVGALLRNPYPVLPAPAELRRIQARRVAQLAEILGFDRQRLAAWGMAQAVLSAWWSIEDHDEGWEPAIAYAESLVPLLP